VLSGNCLPSSGCPVLCGEIFGGVVDAKFLLIGGGQQAGEFGPRRGARFAAVAAGDFAQDDDGSQGSLGAIVRAFQLRLVK